MKIFTRLRSFLWVTPFFCLALLAGCRLDMRDQPRVDPLAQSSFFADQLSARPPVPDTVARGQLDVDEHLYTGRINGEYAATFPFTITQPILERGQQRYAIFCAPCHSLTGDGKGIVTQYGMPEPPSLHSDDLRDQPPGYFFDIITAGTRVMPSYAARIPPADRWAIIAYIRALQLSQNANASQVPADALNKLGATSPLTQTETITKSDTVTK